MLQVMDLVLQAVHHHNPLSVCWRMWPPSATLLALVVLIFPVWGSTGVCFCCCCWCFFRFRFFSAAASAALALEAWVSLPGSPTC